MLSHREWFFRLSYLSLSLLINPLSAADGGITGWVIKQSVQLIATGLGFGAVAGHEFWKGNGNGAPYGIQPGERTAVTPKIQPLTVTTSTQTGAGTGSAKQRPVQTEEDVMLAAYSAQIIQKTDAELSNLLKINEENLTAAKADVRYYKGKARKEVEDHVKFCEKMLDATKAEKAARVSKKATTVTATTVVLTTKTMPVSEPKGLEPAIPGENLWKMQAKIGDTPPITEAQLKEKKESRKERRERRAKEREENQKELNSRDPGEPPHESGKSPHFRDDNGVPDQHNWNKKEGHFRKDTPTARDLIRKTINKENYRGVKNGKHQYDWTNPETGDQIWVEIIGNKIEGHGINAKNLWQRGPDGFLEPPLTGYVRDPNGGLLRGIAGLTTATVVKDAESQEVKSIAFKETLNFPVGNILLPAHKPGITEDIRPVLKPEIVDNIAKQHAESVKKASIERITTPKDYNDIYQWWPFTNHHLPSDMPEVPEIWSAPSKVHLYEKQLESYKSNGGFVGNYKKHDSFGDTSHIWKKGDPVPVWASPAWARNNKD